MNAHKVTNSSMKGEDKFNTLTTEGFHKQDLLRTPFMDLLRN